MKKKLTAFLTAAVCACSSMGILPVSADTGYEDYHMAFTMLAYAEKPSGEIGYVMYEWSGRNTRKTCTMTSEQMLQIFKDPANFPVAGDIIGINSSTFTSTEGNHIDRAVFGTIYNSAIVDSAYHFETEEFYYGDSLSLIDMEGNSYYYPMSFYSAGYQPYDGLPNPADAKEGDKLTFAMNEYGQAVVCLSVSPLGDVNADSTLNILNVILLNKAVLTGEPLPALENAARSGETDYGQCDFNGNGTLDLDDSLGMMKRMLGIEETTE